MQLAPSPVVAAVGQGHSLAPEHPRAVGSTFKLQSEQLGEAGEVQEQGCIVLTPISVVRPLFPCSLCSFSYDLLPYLTCILPYPTGTLWLLLLHLSPLNPQGCKYLPAQLRSLCSAHQLQCEGSS